MRNPYWYYNPNYYRRPTYENPNYPTSNYNNPSHQYSDNVKKQKPSGQFPYSCMINDKYCDYFDLGDTAPNFTLDAIVGNKKTKVSLSDYLGKWVLIFFYGSNFTFV